MNFLDLAKKRYSSRKYKAIPVEAEKLSKILEAGRVAPTGANTQPQRIIVVKEAAGLEKLKKGANIYGAPIGLIVCGNHKASWKRPIDGKDILEIDSAIVTTHMVMEATDLELDTIWVCYFNNEIIKVIHVLSRFLISLVKKLYAFFIVYIIFHNYFSFYFY